MPEPLSTIVALAALIALVFVVLRQRRARRDFEREVAAWKLRLDLDLEQALTERNQLLDALTEGFLMIDAKGRILFANKAAAEMFPGRQLLGRPVSEVFLDRRLTHTVLDCLETAEPTSTKIDFLAAGGQRPEPSGAATKVWILDAARISETPETAPAFRVVIRDVTSEHHTEQIRKDFVANASHELRTPLAIINGYLENLLDDDLLTDPDMARRFLKIMRKHTERIARIVEDMLVISRLESGEASALNIEPFRLTSCIRDVLERLESVIGSQKAEIETDLEDDEIELHGDRFYWTQVLFNLVENALKQNPREGLRVIIGGRLEGPTVRLWVADDGVGIPAADLEHIFRRFYRVEKHHSQDDIKGTGLGLSIVKRAVEAHGGTIAVSSTPGEDTRFTMTLPARPTAAAASPDPAAVVPDA
jgi:two-component system phosphate regulon sensor histidine kinase PhoR